MRRASSIAIDARMHSSSGIGTYITHLVPQIIRARPDWQFFILGPPAELAAYNWSNDKNVCICPCNAPIYSVAEQFELSSRTPRNIDLFWAPHYNIPLAIRAKLLVTVHDVFHLAMPRYTGRLHKRMYARMMFGAVRRRADTILCDSYFTSHEFLRLVGKPRSALQTIHLGTDESWFQIAQQSRPYQKPYLLFVGNIKPHKNLTTLMRAFGLVMGEIPHDLIIVGKRTGFITADVAVAAMARDFGDRISFTGVIDRPRLQQYFAHADALVFPSLYEGFGLPPLEAMACGCPVIASSVASIPEVCGDAALYCDPRSPANIARQIVRLLRESGLRAVLQQRGRQQAEFFSGWGRCAEQTLNAIDGLLTS